MENTRCRATRTTINTLVFASLGRDRSARWLARYHHWSERGRERRPICSRHRMLPGSIGEFDQNTLGRAANTVGGDLHLPLPEPSRCVDDMLAGVLGDDHPVFGTMNDIRSRAAIPFPYFYLACGTNDSFLTINRAFARKLSNAHLGYQYHETAGGHTRNYWDTALGPMLQAIEHVLTGSADRAPKLPRQQ